MTRLSGRKDRKGRQPRRADDVPAIDEELGDSEEDQELRQIADAARKHGIHSLKEVEKRQNREHRPPK